MTFGRLAISSTSAPIIFPNSLRDSMIIGSHSSQFSPKSCQSSRYSRIAFRTLTDGGPVPALSKYARRDVTGISFLTASRSKFKHAPMSKLKMNLSVAIVYYKGSWFFRLCKTVEQTMFSLSLLSAFFEPPGGGCCRTSSSYTKTRCFPGRIVHKNRLQYYCSERISLSLLGGFYGVVVRVCE